MSDSTLSTNPAKKLRKITPWFLIICFAYYYKTIACGIVSNMLGQTYVCYTMIQSISTNNWAETLIYAPLMWFSFHMINEEVFNHIPRTQQEDSWRRKKLLGQFVIAIYLYGVGLHIANVIEIFSREYQNISSGPVYDLVYFIDEELSHVVQFLPYFFAIGWFVINDPESRPLEAKYAAYIGIAHAVERAIGTIEGSSGFMAIGLAVWMGFVAYVRLRRFSWEEAWNDYFCRYILCFSIFFPIALGVYYLSFGGFVPVSGMGDKQWQAGVYNIGLVAGAIFIFVFIDKAMKSKFTRKNYS